ncbi:unnamed protein product [Gongylonema pulchrum]|uniref:exodeoxyribonuclease III n=1 Tax=Gongylonema pulchrum TaxID=637853 RepID=A0A183DFJ5_9BILA|nr:unnamed protein product [Gongylonema pulchrum]
MPPKRGKGRKRAQNPVKSSAKGEENGETTTAGAAAAAAGGSGSGTAPAPTVVVSGSGNEQPETKKARTAKGGKKRKPEKAGEALKIITWNVAGLRAWIKKKGHEVLAKEDPDIIALQETKCTEIPDELKNGYHCFMDSAERSGHGGVLMLTKQEPVEVIF